MTSLSQLQKAPHPCTACAFHLTPQKPIQSVHSESKLAFEEVPFANSSHRASLRSANTLPRSVARPQSPRHTNSPGKRVSVVDWSSTRALASSQARRRKQRASNGAGARLYPPTSVWPLGAWPPACHSRRRDPKAFLDSSPSKRRVGFPPQVRDDRSSGRGAA
ncbi:hypothetical protein BKA80DRAFT_81295 [Phyllosticta citrichinensis]